MSSAKGISLIVNDVRSAYNVGSLFRTADAFGVHEILLTGISPYPETDRDRRPPHIRQKAHAMISKTALGAEMSLPFRYFTNVEEAIIVVRKSGAALYALEQTKNAVALSQFKADFPCALIVGHEITGISQPTLAKVDATIEIPMVGQKESLNVSVAAGIALFGLTLGQSY